MQKSPWLRARRFGWCCLTVLLLGLARFAVAQAPGERPLPYDSLRASVQQPGLPDSVRVWRSLQACQFLAYPRPDSARRYAERGLRLARRIHFEAGIANAYLGLAGLSQNADDFTAAQPAYVQALRAAQRLGNQHLVGGAYLGLASVAQSLNNEAGAAAYYERALAAYGACRPPDTAGQLLVLHNRANYLIEHGQAGQAAPLLRQALPLLRPATYPDVRIGLLILLGAVHRHEQHPDSATATWRRAAALAHTQQIPLQEAEAYAALARLSLDRRQPAAARGYLSRALTLYRHSGAPQDMADCLRLLARALHELRRAEAYDTLQRAVQLEDSLLLGERTRAVANAQARFDQAEQRARIRTLEQQQRIDALKAEQRALRTRLGLGGGLGASLLLTAGLVRRYRRRQARREARLRSQIAADLHDDVGTLLSQISLQSNLLQVGLADPASQRQQLGQITEASRAAVRQLNDVVWSLDAHNDGLPQLLDRLRDYAHEVCDPAGLAVEFVLPATIAPRHLPVLLRRNLYLIYKESLHNVLKHAAGATRVRVQLQLLGEELSLTVDDNAPGPPSGGGRRSGHGLRNIGLRAAALGGQATCGPHAEGQPGFGVQVRVPLPG